MVGLPSGTVTLLFADVEGSTGLLRRLGEAYPPLLADLRRLLGQVFEPGGGVLVDTQGDSVFFAFPSASRAVTAAVEAQRQIADRPWSGGAQVAMRIGLHTGEAVAAEGGYAGLDVHRAARVAAAAHGRQILVSETTRILAEDLEGVTFRDLGQHRLKDLTRPVRLFQILATGLPAEFPPPRTLDALPHNLPIHLTSFIGREEEMAELEGLLDRSRVVTLTGAGGSGKTRLAAQVAAAVAERFPGGVWWVDLTPVSDPARVLDAVAGRLGVSEEPGRSLRDTLVNWFRPRTALLVLDNCEHVVDSCGELGHALLVSCPALRIMATSRERLGLPGEMTWRVPSLSLPDGEQTGVAAPLKSPAAPQGSAVSTFARSEAVRLFIDRAAAVQPGFALTPANAAAIGRICRTLDGIPLAIELAAARVNVLTPQQIADRLNQRFALLADASRMTRPRHQTLRAVMDWSHDLLTEEERRLLARLSVFAGGFTLEAAEAICAGAGVDELHVLTLLARLVDKSLVIPQTVEGEARFRMLETVREYARGKLEGAGEAREFRRRHREWFLALAEQAEPRVRGPEQATWLERLDRELDNLRAALAASRDEDESAEGGLRLAAALWRYWDMRGYLSEGRRWLEENLARPGADAAPPAVTARALAVGSMLAHRQGDYGPDGVPRLAGEALRLARAEGDEVNVALALHHLAHAIQAEGNLTQAAATMDESIALFRRASDLWGTALSLNCRGDIARNQNDDERAAALFQEALTLWGEVGDRWGLSASRGNLGWIMEHRGDLGRAQELFEESLTVAKELGLKAWMAVTLSGIARCLAEAEPDRAATILAAQVTLYAAMAGALEASERPDFERTVALVKNRLGEERFAAAWASGEAMTLERAVEFALTPAAGTEQAAPLPRRREGPLTPREQEVAALVARGLSNREIASLLFVTERTAETHVQNILNKLAFKSRAQIAAWAAEHGLAARRTD